MSGERAGDLADPTSEKARVGIGSKGAGRSSGEGNKEASGTK